MRTLILLLLITACYAAYNLLVKVSSSQAGDITTAPIMATISLQITALSVSMAYFIYLVKHNIPVSLPGRVYPWAIAAGVCIGLAEVLYFYLFRGFANEKPVAASTAIPFIVGGTIVIALVVSRFVFNESLTTGQWIGVGLAFAGMCVLAFSAR